MAKGSFQSPPGQRGSRVGTGGKASMGRNGSSNTPLNTSPITPSTKKKLSTIKKDAITVSKLSQLLKSSAKKTEGKNSKTLQKESPVASQLKFLSPLPPSISENRSPNVGVTMKRSVKKSTKVQEKEQHVKKQSGMVNKEQKQKLKALYSLIRKKTGQLGGGGAGGAIYGEITQESFQRVVDTLCEKCEFSKDSVFLDIGAGLGKPNFHVAISPGVKQSLGVELIGGRWWQSMCLLLACLEDPKIKMNSAACFFGHADVVDMMDYEPVTHVYSFNRGFPPYAMRAMAEAFHRSKSSKYFICFDKHARLVDYGFKIELVDFVTTKMAGSGEQHRCFIYKKVGSSKTKELKKTSVKLKSLREIASAASTDSRTPVQLRTRSARSQMVAAVNQVETQEYTEVRKDKDWTLVKPPASVDFAPHVPHAETYMNGLKCQANGAILYKEWVREQIGLHRSERTSRRRVQRIKQKAMF